MLGTHDVSGLIGRTVYSTDGQKIGELRQVYLDDRTEQLQFITVKTGLFGTNESFVPAADATSTADGVTVPFGKDTVKNAPTVDADGHISPDQEREIYAYYGLASDAPTPGTTTDSAMTRSEEQLHVGTEQHEAGRVRLRKWVETEAQSLTVPVAHERAVIERQPVLDVDVDQALAGHTIGEEVHEVILHEERAVLDKTVAPVERVRLDKETVVEQETVSSELRKERIQADGDIEPR